MIAGLLARVAGWKGYVLVLGLGLCLGSGSTWWLRDQMAAHAQLAAARAETKQVKGVLVQERKADAASQALGQAAAERQVEIQYVTRTQIKEVPTYVTVQTDARFPVPVGLVRVHDAGALGVGVSEIPAPAGKSDGDPSDITASQFGAAVTDNYGACRQSRQQLIDLQTWIRTVPTIAQPPPPAG